jgi:hypothetical protein
VHAEIVDLAHLDFFAIGDNVDRDARNKRKERVFLSTTDAQKPVLVIARRRKSPAKEGHFVIEPEHRIIVLHVVAGKELVQVLGLFIVLEV